ncbi:MAG: hypothetical protein MI799_23070 [Desulfobacterales bacterium]|nr:hypothetical protein [Desulfobacterales bacterium]
MIEMVFDFLNQVGFTHPVHPAFTHIPMGMVMGAVVFRFASLLPKLKMLAKTGYHCVILGLLGLFPTVLTGIMDWQYRYGGEWEGLIILKMILALVLGIVLIAVVVKDDPENPKLNWVTLLYFVLILLAVGLGYSGGELIFG